MAEELLERNLKEDKWVETINQLKAESAKKVKQNGGLVKPKCCATSSLPLKPSVGRIVHYFPHDAEFGLGFNESSPLPAIIVRVWTDECVNLKVITDGPHDIWRTSVTQKPKGVDNVSGFWDWPAR